MKNFIAMALFCAATVAWAADQSPAQQIKKVFVNDCVARGIQRHDDALDAARFCTCAFDVMARELTVQEYIEIDKASQERRAPESVPALLRVKEKMAICKK